MRKAIHKRMPKSRIGRTIVGLLLIIGGILGFLPVLGFWMIPLGLIILSYDSPLIRRWRRKREVQLGRWWHRRRTPQANTRADKGQDE